MAAPKLTRGERLLAELDRKNAWMWTVTAFVLLLLGLGVISLYIATLAFLPADLIPVEHTPRTLAVSLAGLLVVFALLLLHHEARLKRARREAFYLSLQEESLRSHLSELSALFDAAIQVQVQPALDLFLDILAQRLLDCMACDRAQVVMVEERDVLVRTADRNDPEALVTSRAAPDAGLVGLALRVGEPVTLAADDLAASYPEDVAAAGGATSAVCVPIAAQRRTLGALVLLRRHATRAFTAREASMVRLLAEHLGIAIERVDEMAQLDRRVAELEESNNRFAQLEALKRSFLAMVNHEARTPLACIIAYSDFLLAQEAEIDVGRRMRYTRIIHEQARFMQEVLDEEVDLYCISATRDTLRRDAVSWSTLLGEVCGTVGARAAKRGVALELDGGADELAVEVDLGRMGRGLKYLLSRVVRLAREGESLLVRAGRAEDDGGGWATLEIVYRGTGFAELSAAAEAEGTGSSDDMRGHGLEMFVWGFHLVQNIVEYHGGRVWASPAEAAESRFHLVLPLAAAPGSARAPEVA